MIDRRSAAISSLLAWLAFSALASAQNSFQLRVNDVSGLDAPWPLVGGLPFPEGELRDASRIRIVDAQGNEVAAQVDVAATWRDGSIRWALAGLTASPQGEYRVEYGPGVSRAVPEHPLVVDETADGVIRVETGAAVYEFEPDKLLPESARMGDTVFLADAGDGAYLVDNQGRLSRVAGARAEVETEIVKRGPMRAVVRREGWYVTGDGERVARAKAWFYFAAGVPVLRITHTLVFTEDTNELWVRDYGLTWRTPNEPEQVIFPHREAEEAEKMDAVWGKTSWENISNKRRQEFVHLLSGDKQWKWKLSKVIPHGDEVYLLQDVYPHFLERDFRAVIGRSTTGGVDDLRAEDSSFWLEAWEKTMDVAGDWADAEYKNHGLTIATPWLAQQFPKEIAFGPNGARVALWSGRSSRELDFRPLTLVNEYWQQWATGIRGEDGVMAPRIEHVAGMEKLSEWSNARGAARTHDIWLLPRGAGVDEHVIRTRTRAASNPPLLQADPQWLTATEAMGWPMHPQDEERFPRAEAVLSEFWDGLMAGYNQLRRTGLIGWGGTPSLRHAKGPFYRLALASDYGLRRNVWGVYARSGERSYQEFGTRFNRYLGDWELCHWGAGEEYKGSFAFRFGNRRGDPPIHWGDYGALFALWTTHNWPLEHYFTGDEYVMELARMNAEAVREHWDGETLWPHGPPSLNTVIAAYTIDRDQELGRRLRDVVHALIDLDAPNGFNDSFKRFGALYKVDRDMVVLYNYYRATGDEKARRAFLKAADYKYRFFRMRGAFSGQAYPSFLFAMAYKWTGNPHYLRVVNDLLEQHRSGGRTTIHTQMNPLFGTPVAMAVMADAEGPIDPFPVLRYTQEDDVAEIVFTKQSDAPVEMGMYLRLAAWEDVDAAPEAIVAFGRSNSETEAEVEVEVTVEKAFRTHYERRRDMRGRHVHLKMPAQAPAGEYTLRVPNAERVVVLDSDAGDIRIVEQGQYLAALPDPRDPRVPPF